MAIVADLALRNSELSYDEDDFNVSSLSQKSQQPDDRKIIGTENEQRLRRFGSLLDTQKLYGEYSCTYLNVGWRGTLCTTQDSLIWFDKLPPDDVKKQGDLWRYRRFLSYSMPGYLLQPVSKCMFILREETLCYYKDPNNLYSPQEVIRLNDIEDIALAPDKDLAESGSRPKLHAIEIKLNSKKSFFLFAESEASAREWLAALFDQRQTCIKKKKSMSNISLLGNEDLEENSILIVIPFSSITNYEIVQFSILRSSALSITTSTKQYTFTHFLDVNAAFFEIRELILYDKQSNRKKDSKKLKEKEDTSLNSSNEIELKPIIPDDTIVKQFREDLKLPETEEIIAECKCAMVPYQGRLYLSTNFLSFYSSILGIVNMAIIPLRDIDNVESSMASITVTTRNLPSKPKQDFTFTGWSVSRFCLYLKKVLDSQSICDKEVDTLSENDSTGKTIVMLIVGSRGDVQPFIAFALDLQKEGYIVKIATHEAHKKFVEEWNIEFLHLAGDPKDLMALCSNNDMFSMKFFKEGLAKFTKFIEELLDSAWDACQGADIIIQNPPAMAGVHIAEKLQIPLICAFTMPWSRTHVMPNPFAVPNGSVLSGNRYNYVSYIAVEQGIWQPTRSYVNKFRQQKLGLPPIPFGSKGHSLLHHRKIPFLYCWSPSVLPKPYDWPEHIHVTGYWFLDAPLDWKAPQDLIDFIENGSKPIYIGFGSIVIDNPDELTDMVISAVKTANVRAILVKGWGGFGKEEYPDCIYSLDSVPHDWLFPKMAGVVHHGGAGTTAAGLRAGVPTLIVPFFGDQFFWADMVAQRGVGVQGIPFKSLTAAKLSEALIKLTTDASLKTKTTEMAQQIRSEKGTQVAVQALRLELKRWNSRNKAISKSGSGLVSTATKSSSQPVISLEKKDMLPPPPASDSNPDTQRPPTPPPRHL